MNLNNWGFDTLSTIFMIIFFPIFLYVTYWFWISGIIGLNRMIKSKKWKYTIGKIINAEIKFMDFSSSEGDVSFKFVIEKQYLYNINGIEYKSNQTLASDSLYAKDFKTMNEFPKKYGDYSLNANYINTYKEINNLIGRPITIYYDPKNPQKACLIKGINKEIFLPILMGLFFSLGLTYLTLYILKPLFE